MNTLANTLGQFSAVIRTCAEFEQDALVCPNYPAQRGVGVYRNNYRGNLHDTLAGAYPVIRQLVGEEFFRLLAKRFIEQHPSRSGNLHRYGGEMAEFLAHFENTRHLAYLPDMARLEWAYHRAYFADDAARFDLTRLASVPPESYAGLRWQLHPSCTLLATAFPVAAIWRAHQESAGADFNIDLDSGGDNLLVYRNGLSVNIIDIPAASLHWLEQLRQDIGMGAATESTLAAYPEFDLGTALQHWLANGVLVDFETLNATPAQAGVQLFNDTGFRPAPE
ncbi:MAG: putative DNA-binding domain-containing protein [Nitrosomonadales bacterium]|nr:putative DNA-binding domain-containing protein [Nitrosomonadales bacterium]